MTTPRRSAIISATVVVPDPELPTTEIRCIPSILAHGFLRELRKGFRQRVVEEFERLVGMHAAVEHVLTERRNKRGQQRRLVLDHDASGELTPFELRDDRLMHCPRDLEGLAARKIGSGERYVDGVADGNL